MNFIPGDVVFVMHKDEPVSRLFAWFMRSKWSHAAIVKDISKEAVYLCETSDFEVTIGEIGKYLEDPNTSIEVWRIKSITGPDQSKIKENLKPLDRKTYGYLQLLSLALRCLLMRFGIKIGNFIRQGLVCCHVVGYAYQGTTVYEIADVDPESYDTEELYKIIKGSRFVKVFEKL